MNIHQILFILTIMVITCTACSQPFKNTQGLALHRKKCKQVLPTTIEVFQKRQRRIEREKVRKLAKREKRDIAEERKAQDEEFEPEQVCNKFIRSM